MKKTLLTAVFIFYSLFAFSQTTEILKEVSKKTKELEKEKYTIEHIFIVKLDSIGYFNNSPLERGAYIVDVIQDETSINLNYTFSHIDYGSMYTPLPFSEKDKRLIFTPSKKDNLRFGVKSTKFDKSKPIYIAFIISKK